MKARPLACFQHASIYLVLPPEPVLVALSAGWLPLQTATVEEDSRAGVSAQEEEQPWSHTMRIHNSPSWLSVKAMDTQSIPLTLFSPIFVPVARATAALSSWAWGWVALPPTPTSRPSSTRTMMSFCRSPTASRCPSQQRKEINGAQGWYDLHLIETVP